MTSGELGAVASVVIALALLWALRGDRERPRRRNFRSWGSE